MACLFGTLIAFATAKKTFPQFHLFWYCARVFAEFHSTAVLT
jgi:hypothetical protein